MRKWMNRLTALILAVNMTCMLPGMAAFAEDVDSGAAENIEAEAVEEGVAAAAEAEAAEEDNAADAGAEAADEGIIEDAEAEEAEAVDEDIVEAAGMDEAVELSSLSGTLFDDVNAGDWHVPYVSYVLSKGIMTGKGENRFAPSEELSRAQFATVLHRIAGSPDVAYTNKFPDVPNGMFFTRAALWASQDEIAVVKGYDDGSFGPTDMITREQMATMLYRYAEYRGFEGLGEAGEAAGAKENGKADGTDEAGETGKTEGIDETGKHEGADEGDGAEKPGETKPSVLDSFPDTGLVSDFAREAMEWVVSAGIITGDNGQLNPQGNTSRAVCATMIQRFCDKVMPGELQDVDMSAGCRKVSMTQTSVEEGAFWVKAEDVSASMEIQKVQAKVWCYGDKDDVHWYTLDRQSDGSYGTGGSVTSHKTHFGTYYAEFYVMLSNGVRLYLDWTEAKIDGSEAQIRVAGHVNDIYDEVGRDLYACYMWVVNNVSYKRLPNPLDPPEGYDRAQWYAINAYEQRQGNCYCFAAAFYFLAKGLGYDAEFIEGRVKLRSGGYNQHGWVIIHLDGASYICDPESTRDIGRYNFYMQPVSSPVMQYEW